MPALVATKNETSVNVEFNELVAWFRAREIGSHSDFLVELDLIEAPTLKLVAGRHFDVVDDSGSGQTRIYVIDRDDDAVLYMSTSRGMRSFMRTARTTSQLMPIFEDLLIQFARSPNVVGRQELSAADLSEELGRPVLS